MPRIAANGIEIEYETHGSPSDPAVLLVCGFTSQMTTGYDPVFAEMIAAKGRFVIRYDNRDVGLTTHLDGQPAPFGEIISARNSGNPLPKVAYTLSDMAADGMALAAALGHDRVHVVGSSMGGMIVQTMAIEYPTRVASMTSIMSTTGEREFGQSTPEAYAGLTRSPAANRDEHVNGGVEAARCWSSKRYFNPERSAARLGSDWDRGIDPAGNARQMCAIVASPPRAEALRTLSVPSLVIHGRDDTLIAPSGGERTAELIPGSVLAMLADMGHDLPVPLWPLLADLITGHQARAEAAAS